MRVTQVVWKSTKRLGCAQAQCGDKIFPGFKTSQYLVCEYSPRAPASSAWGGRGR